jgi:thiamine biosynthesis protein ThiS
MIVIINGERREIPDGLTVIDLVAHLGMATNRIAIERNLEIVPRADWTKINVLANDSYEIVHFVGGG